MIIIYLFFFASLSECYAQMEEDNLSLKIKNEYEDLVNDDKILTEPNEECLNKTDINKVMARILDEIKDMKDCFLNSKENIPDLESISACTADVEESIREMINFTKPEAETEYHAGINDPGNCQVSIQLICILTVNKDCYFQMIMNNF